MFNVSRSGGILGGKWGGGGAHKLSIIHALQTPPADQDLEMVGLHRDSIHLKAYTSNNAGVVDQN